SPGPWPALSGPDQAVALGVINDAATDETLSRGSSHCMGTMRLERIGSCVTQVTPVLSGAEDTDPVGADAIMVMSDARSTGGFPMTSSTEEGAKPDDLKPVLEAI